MFLKKIGSNMQTIELEDGTLILFSYETPVAGFVPGHGWVRTSRFYSSTTSKHINKFLKSVDKHAVEVPQEVLSSAVAF